MDGEKLMKARGEQPGRQGALADISRRRGSDETGSVLVEFALILPIFAAMLFGMIQFGLVFAGWSSFRNSVETSARMFGHRRPPGLGQRAPPATPTQWV